jgi:hypothetical protein
MSDHDPLTGEVLPRTERAADGRALAPTATLLSQLIAVMGEGEFDRVMAEVLTDLVANLRDYATAGDGIAKGKLTINIGVKLEGAAFFLEPTYKLQLPTDKFGRALMFATDDNRFTPNPPLQGQLFGVRDATPGTRFRSA